ncbi:hypothetical protein KC320_g179 [Hortaea werneckii]|nr:hypothetical protein KC320_g179 [Hortaea werneckii]
MGSVLLLDPRRRAVPKHLYPYCGFIRAPSKSLGHWSSDTPAQLPPQAAIISIRPLGGAVCIRIPLKLPLISAASSGWP